MSIMHTSGWVTRSVRLKNRSFLAVIDRQGEHRVVIEGKSRPPRLGDYVRIYGSLQTSHDEMPPEVVADNVEILMSAPAPMDRQQIREWIEQRATLERVARLRSSLREGLARHAFTLSETSVLAGDETTFGATAPFAVISGYPNGYLTVNNIANLIAMQTVSPRRRYAIGKLFWQHSYNNRYSLNEVNTLDLTAPDVSATMMMDIVDDLVLDCARAVDADPSPPLRLAFDEVTKLCGLSSAADGLSIGAGKKLAKQLGKRRFWIMSGPATGSPYYCAIETGGYAKPRAVNFELWVDGVPNVVSGSVWAHRLDRLNLSADPGLLTRQRALIECGLGEGAGATVGLDRLSMALLNLDNVRRALLTPRTQRSFRSAPADIGEINVNGEFKDDRISADGDGLADRNGAAIAEALSILRSHGYAEVATTALTDAHFTIGIDWFGRRVGLASDLREALCRHVSAGLPRVVAIRPLPGKRSPMQTVEAVALCDDQHSANVLVETLRRVLPGGEFATYAFGEHCWILYLSMMEASS